MIGLAVIVGSVLLFYVLANIFSSNSNDEAISYNRNRCKNKLERSVFDYLVRVGVLPVAQEKVKRRKGKRTVTYSLDFAIYGSNGRKACIEVDGYIFHATKEAQMHDREKDQYLKRNGWDVIRLPEKELKANFNDTLLKTEVKLNDMGLLPLNHRFIKLSTETK